MDITLDIETDPSTRIQPTKLPPPPQPPLSNGVLKRHHHLPPPVLVSYKECLKNHAATLGGHALDGCGEFMPSPSANVTDPTSLKCAACGCHRNFHRRDPEEQMKLITTTATTHVIEYQPHHRHHPPPPPGSVRSPNSASPPPISSAYYPSAPHMLLALSAGVSAPLESANVTAIGGPAPAPLSRKRFRTKFSTGQKERMQEFADRVGWKMQKRDEDLMHDFCNEIGVDKSVLKVWMHNNKNTLGKKDINNGNHENEELDYNHQQRNDGGIVDHVVANGSSSTS